MHETYFTSKEASEITGCTLRQLQYWRDKGVLTPGISDVGNGRTIYYSKSSLVELAAMVYWLTVGLSLDLACETLKNLKDVEPDLFTCGRGRRFMLLQEASATTLSLVEYDRNQAIAFLDAGKPVIPVWIDVIYQQLLQKLEKQAVK
ncbi:MerR family transcriptional regulator [Fortiea contorta]|uniref:MerR family transcriptional regulator n=1 Tax=Fortiea contorta TaxID=1892405 RepID=UPI000344CBBD|nr:MerR family transcriptional regulator [Fortiea contorta]